MDRPYDRLLLRKEGNALWVTLNNPARKNAIGPVMVDELLGVLADATASDDVHSIVLTGANEAFCAGGDFGQMTSPAPAREGEKAAPRGDYADLLRTMMHSTKPIVARVNGLAMGGGLGLVAASHFAIGVRGAKFGTPEINVGLFPMMIMAVLARVVPRRRLLEMMLLGEPMDADEALRLGVLTRVVERADLDAEVNRITGILASKSPTAIRLGLSAFTAQDGVALEEALPDLRDRLWAILSTDDAREGLLAFSEKRAPKWSGR